jgi:hypothetical protein
MHRLLQLGTLMLLFAALAVPLFELFDRWDAPGVGSDTEMGVFALVLVCCLVLLVAKLIAGSFGKLSRSSALLQRGGKALNSVRRLTADSLLIPPQFPPPLRI